MKKRLFIALLSIISLQSTSQITLTQSNFGKLNAYNYLNGMGVGAFNYNGNGLNFDWANNVLPYQGTMDYIPASDPYFTAQCDVYLEGTHSVSGLMYNVDYYYTTNANFYGENALYIPAQAYNQSATTGGANDSIIFPEQKILLSQAREIVHFPMTTGYTHTSDSRRAVNFNISVAGYGLSNAPAQNVFHTVRHDTVVGSGQMRVKSAAGTSKYYNVLVMKSWQQTTDSFYLGGAPAPAPLLSAFGVTQGMTTNTNNRLYFFRENRAQALATVYYGGAPFDSYTAIDVDGDSLSFPNSIVDQQTNNIAYVLYPNPCRTNQIQVVLWDQTDEKLDYVMYDIRGQVMNSGTCLNKQGKIDLPLSAELKNGTYVLKILNRKKESLLTHTVQIDR